MRPLLALLVCSISLLVGGCESAELPTRLRERFEAPQPKTRVYAAEQRAVFEAAQRAVKRIDFIASRSGAAKGLIKAHSVLHSGQGFGIARQHSIDVRVQSFEPGQTQVAVILREQEESESFKGATDIPLKEHALYNAFFGALDAELGVAGQEVGAPAP